MRFPQLIGAIVAAALFLLFSFSIRETSLIWWQTRIFGLIAFFALFLTLLLGELRMLSIRKLKLFRWHKPLGIFTVFLVALHGLSGFLDAYKWGPSLSWFQYLGFSFGDKWLLFLSFGTLAFYLLLLIGLTSSRKGMQALKFKRWKLVHYTSYVAFLIAYVHSINLGTDLKAGILHTIVFGSFLVVTALLLVRVIHAFGAFSEQREITFSSFVSVALLIIMILTATISMQATRQRTIIKQDTARLTQQVNVQESNLNELRAENAKLAETIKEVANG